MKNCKLKTLSICLLSLILLLSTSPVLAMEKDEDSNLLKAQEFAENANWNCVLTNKDTNTSIGLESEISVMQIDNLRSVTNESTGETQYYQEAIANIPIEAFNATLTNYSGTFLDDELSYDPNHCVTVRLGMFYTMGNYNGFQTFRVDGVHVEYNVIQSGFWFTEARTGYRVQGPGVPSGWVDTTNTFDIYQAETVCDIDFFEPSPVVELTGENFNKKSMFYGTLTNSQSSWSFLITSNY